jgi:hypothetical protein
MFHYVSFAGFLQVSELFISCGLLFAEIDDSLTSRQWILLIKSYSGRSIAGCWEIVGAFEQLLISLLQLAATAVDKDKALACKDGFSC